MRAPCLVLFVASAAPLCSAFVAPSSVLARGLPQKAGAPPSLSQSRRVVMMAQKEVDAKKFASDVSASTEEMMGSAKEAIDKAKAFAKDFKPDDVADDAKAVLEGVKKSLKEGEAGQRGEALVAAQLTILLFILLGDVPFVGGLLNVLAGPGLLLGGASFAAAGVLQLGKDFSPFTVPSEGSMLKTTGAYSICRHPAYTGLVLFGLGAGFTTDSFVRISLSLVLAYVLDKKATKEEEALEEAFPAYSTYKDEVAKFLPKVY